MGYQELLFKTKEDQTEKLMDFIKKNKTIIEDPPCDYCYIPSIITFKQTSKGSYYGSGDYEFKEGETYFWAVGQRSAVTWIPSFLKSANFDIDSVFIEYVPDGWLEGFKDFMSGLSKDEKRNTFENDYVVIQPILYDEEVTFDEWEVLTYELKEKGYTPQIIREMIGLEK